MPALAILFRCLAGWTMLFASPLLAAETQVAVAANFTQPAKEIAAAFQQATGHQARLAFGASGVFYTQISHGAPFDVFLSADSGRPARAEGDGFTVRGTRFTYAVGRLVLYSATPGLVDSHGDILASRQFDRLAIADPATAPYGAAAVEAMRRLGVEAVLKPKIVTGSSIAQTYQFVATGAAEIGFVALSQVTGIAGGSRWIVPARLHAPIDQQAVLLKNGARNPAARAFMKYLKSPAARAIIHRYGYATR